VGIDPHFGCGKLVGFGDMVIKTHRAYIGRKLIVKVTILQPDDINVGGSRVQCLHDKFWIITVSSAAEVGRDDLILQRKPPKYAITLACDPVITF
jgi:hypothetical protein